MNVFHRFEDCPNELRRIPVRTISTAATLYSTTYVRFVVIALGTYTIKQLTTRAKIKDQIQVVGSL